MLLNIYLFSSWSWSCPRTNSPRTEVMGFQRLYTTLLQRTQKLMTRISFFLDFAPFLCQGKLTSAGFRDPEIWLIGPRFFFVNLVVCNMNQMIFSFRFCWSLSIDFELLCNVFIVWSIFSYRKRTGLETKKMLYTEFVFLRLQKIFKALRWTRSAILDITFVVQMVTMIYTFRILLAAGHPDCGRKVTS